MDIESDTPGQEWDGVNRSATNNPQGKGKDGPSIFMKLEKREEPYRVRLICAPLTFRKHWQAFSSLKQFPVSPANEVEDKDLDVAWSRGGFIPRKRYCVLVLDRECDNKIRVLEGGTQIFKVFSDYTKMFKKNPAGVSGPDWLITAGTGDNDQTAYTVMQDAGGPKPFTADEVKLINASKLSREWMRQHLVDSKRASPEEIKELWMSLAEPKKYAKPEFRERDTGKAEDKSAAPAEPAAEKPAVPKVPEPAKAVDDGFLGEANEPPPDQEGEDEKPPAELF